MSNSKNAWDASTWSELQSLTTLDEVKSALLAKEKNRSYHKTAYLKRAEKLTQAELIIAEAERRGIKLS
jgi:hypothetical protein